jgi:hypothetical protein
MKTEKDFIQPWDMPPEGVVLTIKSVEVELVDGKRRLVIYWKELEKGLILSRHAYEELKAIIGPSPKADAFFEREGRLQ